MRSLPVVAVLVLLFLGAPVSSSAGYTYSDTVERLVLDEELTFGSWEYDPDLVAAYARGNGSLLFSQSVRRPFWVGAFPLVDGDPVPEANFSLYPDLLRGNVSVEVLSAVGDVRVVVDATMFLKMESYSTLSRVSLLDEVLQVGDVSRSNFSERTTEILQSDNGTGLWYPLMSYYYLLEVDTSAVFISRLEVYVEVGGNWSYPVSLRVGVESYHNPSFFELMVSRANLAYPLPPGEGTAGRAVFPLFTPLLGVLVVTHQRVFSLSRGSSDDEHNDSGEDRHVPPLPGEGRA